VTRPDRLLFLFACLALAGPLPARGQPPVGEAKPKAAASGKGVRNDLYGDPLPEGAVARLGTVRLQLADSPTGLAYSPDGKLFAAVSYEGPVVVWAMPSGRKIHEFKVSRRESARMDFSKNGSYLAFSSGARSYVWDMNSGEELPRPVGGEWCFWVAAFAPDGKSIAGTTLRGELRVWSLTDGKEGRAFEKVEGSVVALSFPERDKLLAIITDGDSLVVWDAFKGKRLFPPITTGTSCCISPDGKIFAFDAGKNVVSVRSVADGKELHRLTGHKENVHSLAFSADSGSLAVASRDTTVRVWDVATGKQRGACETTPGGLPLAALSPDGKTVATGGPNHPHAVLFWDSATGKRRNDFAGHTGPIYSLAFSPDGKQVATASWLRGDAEARIWEAATGRLLREFTAHNGGVAAVAFSPDGKRLATSGWSFDRTVKVWDAATGRELSTFTGHEAGVTCLAFSPNGKQLASGDSYSNRMGHYEGRVRLWDLASGKQVKVLASHKGAVQAILFDPGGDTIRVAADGVHTYDLTSGERVGEPVQPRSRVWALALTPDGKVLLTAAAHDSVRLWELASRREIDNLAPEYCVRAAFSPEGRFIAAGTKEGVVLFDRANGKECLVLRGTRGVVGALAFSHDGRLLAGAGGGDTSALVWDVAEFVRRPLPLVRSADSATLDRWCEALREEESLGADRASWALISRPGEAVPRLKALLQPVKESDAKPVTKLIAELDDDKFEIRERASDELGKMGESAAGRLREALKNNPSAEQRRRVEELLARLKNKGPDGESLRATRAVAVLERIGSKEAREVLNGLARGAPDAPLTRDARAALQRLGKREGSYGLK